MEIIMTIYMLVKPVGGKNMANKKNLRKSEGETFNVKKKHDQYIFALSGDTIDANQEILGRLWKCSTNEDYESEIESIFQNLKQKRFDDIKIEKYLFLLYQVITYFNNDKDLSDNLHYIRDMPFSNRVKNVLDHNGILTIEQLCRKYHNPKDLYQLRGVGDIAYQDMIETMHKLGFYFKDELDCEKEEFQLIETLGLDKRIVNILNKQEKVYYVQNLLTKYKTQEDIFNIDNIGKQRAFHILEKLHAAGYALKEE